MYSQGRSFRDTSNDYDRNSDRGADQNHRSRQRLGDSYVGESAYLKKSAKQRHEIEPSSRNSESTVPKRFDEVDSTRVPGRLGEPDYSASRRSPMEGSRWDGHENGYPLRHLGSTEQNGHLNVSSNLNNSNHPQLYNHYNSSVGYGDPYRENEESDRGSEMGSEYSLGNYKYQPWMDKIAGDTFKKGYFDRVSFRPTLHHNSQTPLSISRQFKQPEDLNPVLPGKPGAAEDKGRCAPWTILCIVVGVILIGCVAGVVAYFVTRGEDPPFKYYVVSSELRLEKEFSPRLSDSSSEEFKNLSGKFCGVMKEALQKNTTEYGNQYKSCDVTEFKNGSIIVVYRLYYVFTVVVITKEKVHQDLNNSLTSVDSDRSQLSDLTILTASVTFTVEVQTFETDPVASSVTTTTTTTTMAPTSTLPETTTIPTPTDSTTTETTTELESTTEGPTTMSPESSSGGPTTSPPDDETTTDDTPLSSTSTPPVVTTSSPTEETTTAKSTTTESTTVTPADSSTESTTSSPTVSSTESTTSSPTVSSTESTTSSPTVSSTESTTTTPTVSSTESTTSSPTVSSTESTTSLPTVSSTESTTSSPTVSSTESTTTTPTVSSTESTTTTPTVSSTESTTSSPTVSSTESTTTTPTVSSTESTTTTPTVSSTESTTSPPTVSSTESKTTTPTVSSTESTTTTPTVSSTESTTSSPTVSSTESTTSSPTVSSTESTTTTPTVSSTESTTSSPTVSSTESTTTTPTVSSTESSTVTPTVSSTEITTTKYTADVMVYPVKAVIGEVTTADTCVISPDGDWTQANVTVTNGGTSYVLGKFKPNGQFERPDSLERFDVSMSKNDSKIVVRLILNLTAPTSDVCSFYTMSCSILMNDTAQTIASNGTEISFTAPVSDVSIDSDTNYKEGDRMTFNCSSKVDPDYSFVSVELIKASTLLTTIPGPKPGVDRNSDCSVDFSWVSGPPTPLTIYENDVIVRCVVYNKLLNITKTAEKMLNVSAADVAFTQYSYKNITEAFIEIPCIARSSSQIFQDLEIIRDGVPIASMNRSVNDSRYSVRSEAYNGDVRLILSISSVKCQDQGTYHCKMYKKDNTSLVSPAMSFFVEGSKPTLTLHPDIYEPFARLGLNHVCSTDHVGDERNGNYIEVQIIKPGNSLQFRYPNNIPDSEKDFNPKNNITYMNITGMSAQFLLVSHLKTSSNISCNIRETITFLLDLNMEFDNSTLKCVLKDDREEFSSVESRIAVIPGNYCEGYNDNTKRKHPSNNCNFYVKCEFKEGKMHATGNQCQVGFCFDFSKEQCVTCDSTFICEELTTPGPTTTTVTLPPGKKYVSCNDSSHLVGTSAIVTCIVLDTTFQSLNISFLPAHAPRSEELIGEVLPDGTVKSQDSSSVVLMTNFATLPRTLSMTIQRVECSLEGQFEIMSVGTNSSFAPSLERFKFDVLGNLTKFELHSSSVFQEGTLIEFNCTATLDESHAKIKGYYKKQSDSSFIEIEGLTTVIEKNLSHCLTDVIWKPTNLFTADASFNHAQIKCEMSDWPLAQVMTNITVNKADVAFETYKIEAEIGSRVSVKCLTRNVNSLSFIRIQKVNIIANTSNTVGNISFPSTTFSQSGMTVSYTTDSLTLTISPLDCKDEGYYTCVVGKQDNSEVQAPAMLHVQPQNLPKLMLVNLALNPDIKENDYDERNVHSCSGDTGYPAGLGYLSLMFTNPTTNASYVYDEKTVTEAMKTPLSTSLFKVTLASGLSIVIKDDEEPSVVNCNGTKQIKFLIKATRDWNKAKLRCSVKNSSGEITSTAVEEEIYVIPNSICDNTNGSDTYLHHEKVDGCKYYVRCHNNKPTGQTCTGQLCFDPQNLPCNWCWNVACESEKDPTTTDSMTETTTFPVTTQTTPVTTQATQCPLLSCTPVFVFGMEDANLVCDLNSTAAYEMITVTKNGQSLMTIYSNGTTAYHSNELNKYEGLVSSSFMFTIKNASCSDRADYTFTAEVENLGPCFKTASLDLKAKPEKAELKIDYRWTNGTKTGTHVCTGNTGHPPGTLSLEVKDGESGVYRNYTPSIITNTTTFENCTNKATLSFSIDFSNEHLQGDYIRCVSNNRETLSTSESPFYSQEVLINPLPEDACYVNGDFPYPGKCRQYLQCANNITYIQKCGTTTCFDVSARQCNYNCNSCTT